jgi:DNA topoisomerase VI subunit A
MRGSHNNDDSSSSSDHQRTVDQVSPGEIIRRIEKAVEKTLEMMQDDKMPAVQALEGNCLKRFNLAQSRSFTSILLVMSYCHNLLIENRSATTREVYYFFVTHFRSQRESDNTIREVSDILQVSRTALGLAASPKGK